jgi:hypothetical protein
MARIEYQVMYGATYATMTNVATDVQSVSLNIGRRRQLDQYNANTGSVTMRYPTGYVTPNALWITGTYVEIKVRLDTGLYTSLFTGRITDATVEYGIPYAGGVGNADYVTITMESHFAEWGRLQGNNYAMPADTYGGQLNRASAQTGLTAGANSQYGYFTAMPATTISSTWGDWLNKTVLTMNGRIRDIGNFISPVNQYYKFAGNHGDFSDTTNDEFFHRYEKIEFSSYADNYYTQVNVVPESYATQTVQTGAIPYRTYNVNTLNSSTAQALDYATYLLSTYQTPLIGIESVTCNLNMQIDKLPAYGADEVGKSVSVLFRGTTYNCILEGMAWSGTPQQSSATFYFSAADLNNYLVLDNTVYGKLDSNKLGY